MKEAGLAAIDAAVMPHAHLAEHEEIDDRGGAHSREGRDVGVCLLDGDITEEFLDIMSGFEALDLKSEPFNGTQSMSPAIRASCRFEESKNLVINPIPGFYNSRGWPIKN